MEDSRPPVNEDEAQSMKGSEKKRSFLATWQERLLLGGDKLLNPIEEGTDTEVGEKKRKKGKIRQFMGRLFGNMAATEPIPVDAGGDTGANVAKERTFWDYAATHQEKEAAPEVLEQDNQATVEHETKEVTSITDSQPETEPVAPDTEYSFWPPEEDEQPTGELRIDHNESPAAISPAAAEVPLAPEPTHGPETVASEGDAIEIPETSAPAALEPEAVRFERSNEDDAIVERSSTGSAASVERRTEPVKPLKQSIDRKIDYQTYKLKREIKKRDKELERVIKKNRPEVPQRPSVEQKTVVERVHSVVSQPEAPASRSGELRIEHEPVMVREDQKKPLEQKPQVGREAQKVERVPVPEQRVAATIEAPESKQVEAVLEKVVEAAEHGEPIERQYEQRHEVKDVAYSGVPVSVGAVMHQALARQQSQMAASQLNSAESLRRALERQQRELGSNTLYQSAIKWGFASALVLIVFGLIAYVLMN